MKKILLTKITMLSFCLIGTPTYASPWNAAFCRKIMGNFLQRDRADYTGRQEISSTQVLEPVFAETYYSPLFKSGNCHENVAVFLNKVIETVPSVSSGKLRVLLITRPSKAKFPMADLISIGGREGATGELFHLVAEYEGYIYDLSFGKQPAILPTNEYFQKMYVAGAHIENVASKEATLSRRLLELERIDSARMQTWNQVQTEIQIEVMSAEFYLALFKNEISKNRGVTKFFWDFDNSRPHVPLWKYLGLPIPAPSTSTPSEQNSGVTFEPSGDVNVSVDSSAVEAGNYRQTARAVTVSRPGSEFQKAYNRTNRGIEELKNFYSERMIDLNELRGKVVVDMATGGGLFVEELRENGITAFGLDIALSKRQLSKLYEPSKGRGSFILDSNKPGIFILADAKNTRIADQSVDVIFDTYGLTEHEFFSNPEFLRSVYREWCRILKVGGVIRFAPMDVSYVDHVKSFINTIPGLEFTAAEPTRLEKGFSRSFEFTKVR